MTLDIRQVDPAEADDWDRLAVEVAGGDVCQSRPWAAYRARWGWAPRFLRFGDRFPLLALARPWPLVGGSGAYLSRGPVAAGEPVARTAERLAVAAEWLAGHGVDVIASDAEIPAASEYPELIRRAGFRPIEEVQASRHRMSLPLPDAADESAVFGGFSATTRQLIRGAEGQGLRVASYDARRPPDGSCPPFDMPPPEDLADGGRAAFDRFYGLMVATAARRHFGLAPRAQFLDWATTGLAAGLIVHLEVRSPDGEVLGAAMFYRHGDRLTYSHSGDRADRRRAHPGVSRLLLWRAIQLAMAEGRAEMDLAGVDIPGARRQPAEGEPMYGLYAFKASFGARWVEQTGNHEWIARPARYLAGRVAGRLARAVGR